jgi:hypothetical protein
MVDFIFLMHDDAVVEDAHAWDDYIAKLKHLGSFQGGSLIGDGECVRRKGEASPLTAHLIGYIHVNASGITDAKLLLGGNPHFEAGGTVEIRELPRSE